VLTTVPLTIHPASLRLNLDASAPGARCAVELCDPFGYDTCTQFSSSFNFWQQNDHFTKAGSGQTQGEIPKRECRFCRRTLPGFERTECMEMAGVDSIEQPVRWRSSSDDDNSAPAPPAASSGDSSTTSPEAAPGSGDGGGQELEAKMVSQSRGTVKLRVFLGGGAKLFAIYT
jgi:hypothetical protein